MARYRLPEALGGGECTLVGVPRNDGLYGRVQIGHGEDGFTIDLLRSLLTEVKPPLPEEPPVGAFVACGADGNLLPFYRRWDEGWCAVNGVADTTWAEICSDSQERAGRWPLRLVPDPFAKPVELPWEIKDREGYGLGVYESQRPWAAARVGRGDECVDLTSGECRGMARALMAAADAADKEQS